MKAESERPAATRGDAKRRTSLFDAEAPCPCLPADYAPRLPPYLTVERIVLTRGSFATPERRRFAEAICSVFPDAEIVDRTATPHNKVALASEDPLGRHQEGKRTLVFGELRDALRFSAEDGNTCPNYWHFSPYGFCFYGCKYCYLAGTRGVWFSAATWIAQSDSRTGGHVTRSRCEWTSIGGSSAPRET